MEKYIIRKPNKEGIGANSGLRHSEMNIAAPTVTVHLTQTIEEPVIKESKVVGINSSPSESESSTSEPKARKLYKHKFQEKWAATYPWLRNEQDKIFCSVCTRYLKCSLFDIKRHAVTDLHKRNVTKLKNTPKIMSVLKNENLLRKNQLVKQAELKLCVFLHGHNLPFLLAEHLPSFIRSVCPDS